MTRSLILVGSICLAAAAHAQTKEISWQDFAKEIQAMQKRTEELRAQVSSVKLGQYAKEVTIQDRHGWLSAWSGWLYLDSNDATAMHNRHREILYSTWSFQPGLPATVDSKYLDYYRNGMRELEATHAQILDAFQNYAKSRVQQVVAYERDGNAGKTAEEKVTASWGEKWKKHQKRTFFEADVWKGTIPEPPVLRFGPIKIEYAAWHAERGIANTNLAQVKRSIQARIKDIDAKTAQIRAMGAEIDKLRETYRVKVLAHQQAEFVAKNGPRQVTSPAIRDAERQHAAAVAELARVDPQVRTAKGEAKRQLQSKQRQLRTQRDRAKRQIAMLKEDFVEAAKADASAASTRLLNEKYDALKPLARAESERNIQAGVLDTMQQGYQTDIAEYDELTKRLDKLGSETPVITLIKAPRFEARLWEPEDVLRDLDADIAATQALLREFDDRRRSERQAMLAANEELTRQAEALANSQWASIMAQFGIEVVFVAADLVKSAKEGPAGVLAEASKKLVENLVLGVSYNDANNLVPANDTFLGVAQELVPVKWDGEANKKRLIKTVGTGYPTSYALTAYLASQARADYEGIAQRMVRQSWMADEASFLAGVRRNFQVAPLLAESKKEMLKADKKLAEMGTWKNFLKKGGSSFLGGKVKDITKGAAKQALANLIEGEAWQNHKAAELEFRSHVLLLYQASNMYWKAFDGLEHLRAMRRALTDQYDPGSSMKVNSRGVVETEEDLLIELSDRGSDAHRPSNRAVDLFFGPIKAVRLDGGRLIFRVPAAKLRELPETAQPIRIVVKG